jgi:hypothetical protein
MDHEFSSISQLILNLKPLFITQMKGHPWRYETPKNYPSSCIESILFDFLKSDQKFHFLAKNGP